MYLWTLRNDRETAWRRRYRSYFFARSPVVSRCGIGCEGPRETLSKSSSIRPIGQTQVVAKTRDRRRRRGRPLFSLKQRSGEFRLPDDAQQCAARGLIVKWNRHGYRRRVQTLLH